MNGETSSPARFYAHRAAVAAAIARRIARDRSDLIAVVSEWTSFVRDKADVTETLQAAGVPAAPMNRAVDVPTDPQVAFRKLYTEMASIHCSTRRCSARPLPRLSPGSHPRGASTRPYAR